MRFDSNKAWLSAVALVSANRDVLWALAGVFYVLPTFAFSAAFPQPEPGPGATPDATLGMMQVYWNAVWPWFMGTMLLQLLGTLTILTLFTDRTRPTVGQAIAIGSRAIVPVLLAQMLVGLVMMLAALILIALGTATGIVALAVLSAAVGLIPIFYLTVRTMLVSPVVVVEEVRNPITALRRSWTLTEGNAGRLMLFFVLLVLAVAIVFGVFMLIVGSILAVLLSAETAEFVAALISSLMTGGVSIYAAAVIAAIHRQLAGTSQEAAAKPFE